MNIIVHFTTCFCPSAQTSVIEGLNTEVWLLPWLHSLATRFYQFRNRDSFIPYQSHYQAISLEYAGIQTTRLWPGRPRLAYTTPHVVMYTLLKRSSTFLKRTMYQMTVRKTSKVMPLLWVMVWRNFRFMSNIEKVNTSCFRSALSFFSILTKTTFLP